jgi:hypothetical protein
MTSLALCRASCAAFQCPHYGNHEPTPQCPVVGIHKTGNNPWCVACMILPALPDGITERVMAEHVIAERSRLDKEISDARKAERTKKKAQRTVF